MHGSVVAGRGLVGLHLQPPCTMFASTLVSSAASVTVYYWSFAVQLLTRQLGCGPLYTAPGPTFTQEACAYTYNMLVYSYCT